jgi:hypothetical protein
MFTPIARFLLPLGGAALFAMAAAQPAFASQAEDLYRCRVVGETSACASLPAGTGAVANTQATLGAYGRYLTFLGQSVEQAAKESRARGEMPSVRMIDPNLPGALTAMMTYQRFLGL